MNFKSKMKFLAIVGLIIPLIVLVNFAVIARNTGLKLSSITFSIISLFYFIFSIYYFIEVFK